LLLQFSLSFLYFSILPLSLFISPCRPPTSPLLLFSYFSCTLLLLHIFFTYTPLTLGDDVPRKKPDPMIYNTAQAFIGIPPERCSTRLVDCTALRKRHFLVPLCDSLTIDLMLYPLPFPALPFLTLPYPTIPYPTLPYPTLPYLPFPTLPYHTIPYPTLTYHTLPYLPFLTLTLPYPTLPYPTLPYLICL
jgi:hypothetical protein